MYDKYQICLVIIGQNPKRTEQNYKINEKNFIDTLKKIPNLNFDQLNLINKKMSVITAGLGQYGKNQLVYTKKFGFQHNIWTFGIKNSVINLPIRNTPNYHYADMCTNCNECIKNCPAHAIHGDEYPGWLDRLRCVQFYHYGDHPYITSVKYEVNKWLNHPYSKEQLEQVHNINDFEKLFGFTLDGETAVEINNQPFITTQQFCCECLNQIPCRKVEFRYNKDQLIDHKY